MFVVFHRGYDHHAGVWRCVTENWFWHANRDSDDPNLNGPDSNASWEIEYNDGSTTPVRREIWANIQPGACHTGKTKHTMLQPEFVPARTRTIV